MPEQTLSVAVIGLGPVGTLAMESLLQTDGVKIVGIADKDPIVAEQAGGSTSIPAYSDDRRCLAETRPDAIFLAVPPPAGVELIAACAERGIHVWKTAPLGRTLEEAVEIVRTMDRAGLKLVVGTQRRFAASYRQAAQLADEVKPIFLARAHYLFNWGPELSWRADKASAGGGALLDLGYHPIDLLISMLGLPEDVYGLATKCSRATEPGDPPQGDYDTDDTAAAILTYSSGAVASVVTTRSSGPVSEELTLHGLRGSLTANHQGCWLRDPDGKVLDQLCDDQPPVAVFVAQAKSFAKAVATEASSYMCSGWENLLTMAVIEAVYLSGRTSQPERPARLLKSHGLTLEQCLQCRPKPT